MLQRISNRLVTDVNQATHRFSVLNTIVSVVADHLLPHVNAQGECTFNCYVYICQASGLCLTTGEVTEMWSYNAACTAPYCLVLQGRCC